MSACMNCGTSIGCNCQKRVASNGKSVCAHCIEKYEKALKTNNTTQIPQKPTNTAPTNVNVFYKAP